MAKIAIDAGHGKNASGKRVPKNLDKNETRKWILNARVADALESYLMSAGHEVIRVDDTDGSTDIPLSNRVQKANDWNADYYASIHHNAGINGGSGGGIVVFVYPGTSQIIGMAIVTTTVINSILTVRNPEGTAAIINLSLICK